MLETSLPTDLLWLALRRGDVRAWEMLCITRAANAMLSRCLYRLLDWGLDEMIQAGGTQHCRRPKGALLSHLQMFRYPYCLEKTFLLPRWTMAHLDVRCERRIATISR
jgi:hypothetical protein